MSQWELLGLKLVPDVLACVVLLFILRLLRGRVLLSQEKTHQFMLIAHLTLLIVATEMLSLILEETGFGLARVPMLLLSALGSAMAPVVPFSMAAMYSETVHARRLLLAIPLIVQEALCFVSMFTQWMFVIGPNAEYARGPLYWVTPLASFYGFVLFVVANRQDSTEFESVERYYLRSLYLLMLFGCAVQLLGQFLMIWPCVSIAQLLYYIFLRELEFKYDPLTGVRNRKCFENRMDELERTRGAVVVMFDLNNLKAINDGRGHAAGDYYISRSARIIKQCFRDIGTPYRIGGDEFCVLGPMVDEERLQKALSALALRMRRFAQEEGRPYDAACGYAFFHRGGGRTMRECLKRADEAMYQCKQRLENEPAQ